VQCEFGTPIEQTGSYSCCAGVRIKHSDRGMIEVTGRRGVEVARIISIANKITNAFETEVAMRSEMTSAEK
jgi:hypothetical protein